MEETDFIGKTYFIDENGRQVDSFNYRGKILIVNFPGSGMCLSSKNRQKVDNSANRVNDATKKLILENNPLFQLELVIAKRCTVRDRGKISVRCSILDCHLVYLLPSHNFLEFPFAKVF